MKAKIQNQKIKIRNSTFYFLFSRFSFRRSRFSIFYFLLSRFSLVILLSTFYFLLSTSAFGQSSDVVLTIDLSATQAELGSEIEVQVLVSSQEPVNAFDIVLEYPAERLEFIRASAAGSIVSVWQSLPLANEQTGSLRFVGGMVSPFSGEDGQIITLIFRVKEPGEVAFGASKADFALADGKGTSVFAMVVSRENLLVRTEPKIPSPPKIVETMVAQDPLTKTSIVSIKTEDEGAVREIQMRTRQWFWWGDWQRTGFVAEIPKYAWTAQIAAIGWDWEKSETTIYRWDVAALKLLLAFAVLAVLGYGVKTRIKTRIKTLKYTNGHQ